MRHTKYAFTLVEILIVVAILGILAAIVLPTFQDHVQQTKESAAKETLRIFRNAIALYATQHNDVPPGYPDDDTSQTPHPFTLKEQLVTNGNYLPKYPTNPFNGSDTIKVVPDDTAFPGQGEVNELYGWVYQPQTKTIKLNWYGTDSTGVDYSDY